MTSQPVIFCEPVEQEWWSQQCGSCDHALITHVKRQIWVLEDGSEVEMPIGEAVEIPEGAVKVERLECSSCNLKAAFGGLVIALGEASAVMADLAQQWQNAKARMDNAGIPELEAPTEPTEGETP